MLCIQPLFYFSFYFRFYTHSRETEYPFFFVILSASLNSQKVPASCHRHISSKPLPVQVLLNKKIGVVYDLIFVILDLGTWIWFDFL